MNDQNRQPKGIPVGGQFAASARVEAEVALAVPDWREAAEAAAATVDDVAARRAFEHRIAVADILLDYPDTFSVSTLNWPEEPNEDGTFDVALNTVYGAGETEVENLGDLGSVAAGWYTDDATTPYRTAYDAWREDSMNPDSDIDIAKVRKWRDALAARLDETPEAAARRERRARYEAATITPFDDLRPGDRFMVDRYEDVVEVEVIGEPEPAEDLFGRSMKNLPCRRLDTGAEGPYMYGPDGHARKVALPRS